MECEKGPSDTCRALGAMLIPLSCRKIVTLATATIHNDSLFVNGLFQNVFILYKMLDSMGYAPILLVNEKPSDINKVPSILRNVRMIIAEEILRNCIPIHMNIEIGKLMYLKKYKWRFFDTFTNARYRFSILNLRKAINTNV